MGLSNELISQFAKLSKSDTSEKKESTTKGTVRMVGGEYYVQLAGADQDSLTPVKSTTELRVGDEVTVSIKDHTAIATGNITSPSVSANGLDDYVQNSNVIVKDSDLSIVNSKIEAQNSEIEALNSAVIASNSEITAANANINILNTAFRIENGGIVGITDIITDHIETTDLSAVNAAIGTLNAKTAFIENLSGGAIHFDTADFDAASFEEFFANSGIIKDLDIGGATVSGEIVGVTLKGDLIEAGTIVADKLVLRDSTTGLLYKLNEAAMTDAGLTVDEDDETLQNGLHGSIINDKTIVAEKINVNDLVAFGATIAGFNIKKNTSVDGLPGRLYSGSKNVIGADAAQGIYLDDTGQMNIGNAANYIKLYKDVDNSFKLLIRADEIKLGSGGKTVETLISESISDINASDIQGLNYAIGTAVTDKIDELDVAYQTDFTDVRNRLDDADEGINVLKSKISSLVVGENGQTLLDQDQNGWTFSLVDLLNKANSSDDSLGRLLSVIKIYSEQGSPVLEFGAESSSVKLKLSNDLIQFIDGNSAAAAIDEGRMNIENVTINNELRMGGYSWKKRINGNNQNLGLMWDTYLDLSSSS